jgi:uncharacterized protein DUF6522
MNNIDFEHGTFTLEAAIIAEPLGLDPSSIPAQMREGKITSLCERGLDNDAGRYRLTFFRGNQRLRLVVDGSGTILDKALDHLPSPRRCVPTEF